MALRRDCDGSAWWEMRRDLERRCLQECKGQKDRGGRKIGNGYGEAAIIVRVWQRTDVDFIANFSRDGNLPGSSVLRSAGRYCDSPFRCATYVCRKALQYGSVWVPCHVTLVICSPLARVSCKAEVNLEFDYDPPLARKISGLLRVSQKRGSRYRI